MFHDLTCSLKNPRIGKKLKRRWILAIHLRNQAYGCFVYIYSSIIFIHSYIVGHLVGVQWDKNAHCFFMHSLSLWSSNSWSFLIIYDAEKINMQREDWDNCAKRAFMHGCFLCGCVRWWSRLSGGVCVKGFLLFCYLEKRHRGSKRMRNWNSVPPPASPFFALAFSFQKKSCVPMLLFIFVYKRPVSLNALRSSPQVKTRWWWWTLYPLPDSCSPWLVRVLLSYRTIINLNNGKE